MEFREALILQSMEHFMPADALKMCYQAAFGPSHMLEHQQQAKEYFYREYQQVIPGDEPLFLYISPHYIRVNFRAWKQEGLSPDHLYTMFLLTAQMPSPGHAEFFRLVDVVRDLTNERKLPFSRQQWDYTILRYMDSYPAPVGHSKPYHNFLHPAYRVISSKFIPVILVLLWLLRHPDVEVIAIDGMAGAGKTTLSQLLSLVTGGSVIHMDDFFLPPDLRTKERLEEAGGNIHYERFCEEVLPNLRKNDAFSYRKFDCGIMNYSDSVTVENHRLLIVEGSYSCHPKFGDYMDLKVFLKVSQETQRQRILGRNLPDAMNEKFFTQWIPMENRYHREYKIISNADLVISPDQIRGGL